MICQKVNPNRGRDRDRDNKKDIKNSNHPLTIPKRIVDLFSSSLAGEMSSFSSTMKMTMTMVVVTMIEERTEVVVGVVSVAIARRVGPLLMKPLREAWRAGGLLCVRASLWDSCSSGEPSALRIWVFASANSMRMDGPLMAYWCCVLGC